MRPEAARADRAAAVRTAARAWQRAGVLDAAALAAVEQRYPDDRVRVGATFRTLLFLFTLFAFCGLFGVAALGAAGSESALAFLLLAAGVALCAVTEWLTGPMRRRQGGIEAATSLLALGCVLGGATWVMARPLGLDLENHLDLLLPAAAALLAAAAWRWGYPVYAAAAAATILLAFARLPVARLLWIAVPLLVARPLHRLGDSPRLPPALRAAATAVLLVCLAGLYVAVCVDSWEHRWIEALARHSGTSPAAALGPPWAVAFWWCSAAATALLPVGLLVHGLRRRRIAMVLAGAGGAVLALVTLYRRTTPCPLWLALALGGALAIALALWLWRWLDAGPNGERHGFTAAPLFADSARQQALEIGAVVLTLPQAHPQPPADAGFTGGGGRAGGAGASGEF